MCVEIHEVCVRSDMNEMCIDMEYSANAGVCIMQSLLAAILRG